TLTSDGINDNGYGVGVAKVTIHVLAAEAVEATRWDTVKTHAEMFVPFGGVAGECVALAVSNFGEIGGLGGTIGPTVGQDNYSNFDGRVNLDYKESGLECGTREEDAVYLYSGSPFTMLYDYPLGDGAELTCSYNDRDQADVTGWDPTPDRGSITGGVSTNGTYDSVYTGRFVNRDTSLVMERIFYAPRSTHPANDTINFVICYTKFYSGDGQAHHFVTVGDVVDWDVPSEVRLNNISGISTSGSFVYAQGTDTTGVLSCQRNVNRFAAEAFIGGYTSAEELYDSCTNNQTFYNQIAMAQTILSDTSHLRDGTPLDPPQPNPKLWRQAIDYGDHLQGDATAQNQAIWLTYAHLITLREVDTLHFWTVLTTVRNGSLAQLEAQVVRAKQWYWRTIRHCCYVYLGCCCQRVGNANNLGTYPNEVTISDIQLLVTAKFISSLPCEQNLHCLAEADVNQSGGANPACKDITISDIQTLVNHLFIAGPTNAPLKDCL
ncbi:MAG: hypothetical protein NTW07_09040, partial [candidate division Zixibacteria bacterium]|nr:hypothetical protein [candidate division Zixibacteria bacterium]